MDVASENVKAFADLDPEAWNLLLDLNRQIQEHEGAWGVWRAPSGHFPWVDYDPLIHAFVRFWYEKNLVVDFDWPQWDAGRAWYRSTDERKYSALNVSTALKLLTAVIRNNRFCEGALYEAFESGDFPKIIDRLVGIRSSQNFPSGATMIQ